MAKLRHRLLLLVGASVVALLLGEVAARLLLPGPPRQMEILAANGERVPGSEIAHFFDCLADFKQNVNGDMQQPHGRQQAHLKLRYRYLDDQHSVTVAFNSLGFRDDEFPVDKQPGELRMLALGDSFTHGQGVEATDSWPEVLERDLQPLHRGPVQVINGGFATGYSNPDGYDKWMASDGIRLCPDLVIVGLCLNDLHIDVPMLSWPVVPSWTPTGEPPPSPLAQPPVRPRTWCGSRLLGEIDRWFEQRRLVAEHRAHPPDYAQIVAAAPQQWQGVQRGLRALQEMLQQRGVTLVVAIFPMLSDLDLQPWPYEGLHALVRGFCAQAGIRCVDLRHVFDGVPERELWVDATDQHPNNEGHRRMATGILDYLRREGLVR